MFELGRQGIGVTQKHRGYLTVGGVDREEIIKYRQKSLSDLMRKEGIHALLVNSNENVTYVTGSNTERFYTRAYALFLADIQDVVRLSADIPLTKAYDCGCYKEVRLSAYHDKFNAEAVKKVIEDYKLTEAIIGLGPGVRYAVYDSIVRELPKVKFVNASKILSSAKMLKSSEEMKIVREAATIAETGMEAALLAAKANRTEREVKTAATVTMKAQGAERTHLGSCWVASGDGTAILRRYESERIIRNGELVIIDGGCRYGGFYSELARTKIVGKPKPEQRDIYRTACRALQEIVKALKPGTDIQHIHKVSRDVMKEAGYEKYADPMIGHGIGVDIHQPPYIGEDTSGEIKAGMALCIKPGIYLHDKPEVGGVRLEDMVYISEEGPEILTKTRYDDELLG